VDEGYGQVDEAMREVPGRKILMVMGYWNVVIGEGSDGSDVGESME
jgi:hypothetical protein